MTIALIVGTSEERLWGLTNHQRIARQLASIGGIELTDDLASVPPGESVLMLRADYAYDLPTLTGLLRREAVLADASSIPAAAHVPLAHAASVLRLLNQSAAQNAAAGPTTPQRNRSPTDAMDEAANEGAAVSGSSQAIPTIDVHALDGFEAELRKTEPPLLAPIAPETRKALQDRLYGISYKGITDFITKWWWPVPAKAMVRCCANRRITPNAVTGAGFALMLLVCWLFYEGHYFWGLLLGWFMTFLDTVDGKLARVTVQSSQFGHWLDHGMDIVHPPFWYWLWGLSLVGFEPRFGVDFETLLLFVFAGYVGGRLVEGAFHGFGSVSLFAWRPFDAWFRLFTARRNPCLLLLTAGWLVGEPGVGFELVAWWTLLSTIILTGRLLYGGFARLSSGPLTSWLADADAAQRYPHSFRTFSSTRRAYG